MTLPQAVPNTAGVLPPALEVPAAACDAHIHIYDPRYPSMAGPGRVVARAAADDYQGLQARLGTTRTVVVTPTVYGTDNGVTLDAIARLGRDRARGVAVLHPEVDEATLRTLDAGGVRGIRFTLFDPATAVTTFDMVEPLARRIEPLGWHVQLHWRADQIAAHAGLLGRLACPIVFDHMGRMPHPEGAAHPAFAVLRRLLDTGRTWVKLSAPYLDDVAGTPDSRSQVARALLAHAPQRLVWGSDWPHPTEKTVKPDDAALLDRIGSWMPDPALRQRVLVDNPQALYGF